MSEVVAATLEAIGLLRKHVQLEPVSRRLLLNAIDWLERDLMAYLKGEGQ